MTNKGFSLIEMMVVIAIMGIMATMAIPTQSSQIGQAYTKKAMEGIKPLQTDIVEYRTRNDQFPTTFDDLPIDKKKYLVKDEIKDIQMSNTVDGGLIITMRETDLPKPIQGKVFYLWPKGYPETLYEWQCGIDPEQPEKGSFDKGKPIPKHSITKKCQN